MIGKHYKNIKFQVWTVPLALLALCIISYGLLITELGFYWDDWAKTLVHRIFGLSGYWDYYAGDRPISGWTHIFFIAIIGDKPLYWHALTLLLRWLSAVGMWWTLCGVWPQYKRLATYAAMLFAVYPLFTMQPIPVTFHQQWLQYTLYFISMGAMVQAYRKPRFLWPYTLLSILTMLLQLTVTEYFIGLELLKPVFLWLLVNPTGIQDPKFASVDKSSDSPFKNIFGCLRDTLKLWLPYLLITVAYIIWRLFFMPLPEEDPYRAELIYSFLDSPAFTLIAQSKQIILDTLYIVSDWAQVIDIGLEPTLPPVTLASWFIAIASAVGLLFYLVRLDEPSPESNHKLNCWVRQALFIGLLGAWLGLIPAWITERKLLFDFHSNRFAQPSLFGASLMFIGFLVWLSQRKLQRVVILSILVGFAISFHIRNANEYRWLWKDQTRFYWQLSWRSPYIKPETALISEEEPFPNQGLFSISSALNLLYPQSKNPEHLAYWIYTLNPRFKNRMPGNEFYFNTRFRSLSYIGRTPNTLLVYSNPDKGNCLWVLTPDDWDNPELSELTLSWLYLSNLDRIEPEPASGGYPPIELFGNEPPHGWCYYYQKGELAHQMEDWERLVELGDEARNLGYSPTIAQSNTPHEWLHFIEGYAYAGRWDDAEDLTMLVSDFREDYNPRLCNVWKRINENTSPSDGREYVSTFIYDTLQCSP